MCPLVKKESILFVMIGKWDMMLGHQHADRFVSDDVFEWQSHNATARGSKRGKQLNEHWQYVLAVQLLIRRTKELGGKAAPFTCFGVVDFIEWEWDKPITVRWKLSNRPPHKLIDEFPV
jgi:hypothetical protein